MAPRENRRPTLSLSLKTHSTSFDQCWMNFNPTAAIYQLPADSRPALLYKCKYTQLPKRFLFPFLLPFFFFFFGVFVWRHCRIIF
jgi:hypothetical protein